MGNPSSDFRACFVANRITEPVAGKHKKVSLSARGPCPPGLLSGEGLRRYRAAIQIERRGAQGIGAESADMIVLQPMEYFYFGMAVGIMVGDGDDGILGRNRGQEARSGRR